MDQDVALDTSLGQDVVSGLLVAVASVLTAELLAAEDVQPQQMAALAVAAEPRAVLAARFQVGLKAPGAVEPGQPEAVLPLARLRQDAAVPQQQMD